MDRNLEQNSLKNIKNGRGNRDNGRYKRRARILTAVVPVLMAALIVSGYFLKKAYEDIDRYKKEIEELKMEDISKVAPEATVTPEADSADIPEFGVTVTPKADSADTPKFGVTVTPKAEPTDTPEFEVTVTPKAEPTDTAEFESTVTPKAEPTDTPEFESTVTPGADSADTPELEMTVTPEAEPVLPQESQENDDFPLKKGSRGERVRILQEVLREFGFFPEENEEEGTGIIDGVWGDETDRAVKEYYEANGKQKYIISLSREEYEAIIGVLEGEKSNI